MNNDIKKIVRIRLLLLFLIPGLLIFTAVYSIQSNIEKNRANKDIEGIIQFMKEQRLTGILFLDRNPTTRACRENRPQTVLGS